MSQEYGLAWRGHEIASFFPISDCDFQLMQAASGEMIAATFNEQKIDYVLENLRDLGLTLYQFSVEFSSEYSAAPRSVFEFESSCNRRLMNLLTTAKSYIDSAEHHVGEIFGQSSAEKKSIKGLFRKEYDEQPGYRVMYALRNFAQHSGLPVHGIELGRPVTSADVNVAVSLHIRPAFLKERGGYKAETLKELLELGDRVELLPLIFDFVKALWRVHSRIRDIIDDRLGDRFRLRDNLLHAFFAESPEVEGERDLIVVVRNSDGVGIIEMPLLDDAFRHYELIRHKNMDLENHGTAFMLFPA